MPEFLARFLIATGVLMTLSVVLWFARWAAPQLAKLWAPVNPGEPAARAVRSARAETRPPRPRRPPDPWQRRILTIGAVLILAALAHACFPRYESSGDGVLILDRWTGEVCTIRGRCFERP